MPEPHQTDPISYTNTWLAEMGYATFRMVLLRAQGHTGQVLPETLEDLPPALRHAWLAATAAIRRRVVNWRLPAEETDPDSQGLGGGDDAP